MSISAKLSDIRTAISSAYTAVSNMGGTVPALPVLTALPSAIQTIPSVQQYRNVITRQVVEFADSVISFVGNGTFQNCTSLTSVNLPNCYSLDNFAFLNCGKLTSVSLPNCSYVGAYAFSNCSRLISISLSNCSFVGSFAFANCSRMTAIELPMCLSTGASAFQLCFSLASISLPSCERIGGSAFFRCSLLSAIYIGTSACYLVNTNVFSSTGIWNNKGSIFVPSAYYNDYKTSTNWTFFSDRIFSY